MCIVPQNLKGKLVSTLFSKRLAWLSRCSIQPFSGHQTRYATPYSVLTCLPLQQGTCCVLARAMTPSTGQGS